MYLVKFKLLSRVPVPGSEKLYYRLFGGATCVNDEILLPEGASVSTDAFYNLFSCKHFKFVNTDNLKAEIAFSGEITAELRLATASEDKALRTERAASVSKNLIVFDVPDCSGTEGYLYVKITAHAPSVLYGGGFVTETPKRKLKIGIVVCTYRREEYVKRNMGFIGEYIRENPAFTDRAGFFVVDNGQTLSEEDLPAFVKLIPNENTGGTGGFTRGLKEVMALPENYTHFLFMDDDIVFMPSVIDRTYSLLCAMKEEYSVYMIGGAMLSLTEPCLQHEFGGRWLGNILKGNLKNVNLESVSGLLENERDIRSDYNAWWYMCLSVAAAREKGLPLEMLFIKCDDVEYGLRASEGVIAVNGIGVWHESFDYKFNPILEYFVKRNELIVNARYPRGKGFFSNWFKMVRAIAKALVEYRYFHIDMIAAAYEHFLKGADYVGGIDYKALFNKYRERFPAMLPVSEAVPGYTGNIDEALAKSKRERTKKFLEVVTLNGYLVPKKFYRETCIADMVYPKPVNFYLTRKVVNYNPYTRQAFVSEINKGKLFYGWGKIIRISFAMMFKYFKAAKSYRQDLPKN